jgi:hypothetical protein
MEENSNSNELSLSEAAKDHLETAGNWVYVMSMIGMAIIVYGIISLFYDYINVPKFDDVPTGGGVGFYMIMSEFSFLLPILLVAVVVCFFPLYYLYKFSSNVRMAFRDDDSEALENSFRYLKLHYKSIGILILIYVAYLLVIRMIF